MPMTRLLTPAMTTLLLVGCFDRTLPSMSSPFILCLGSDECPVEFPICSTRSETCVAKGTECVEPDGTETKDGNTCGDVGICVDGSCVAPRCGDGIRSFDEACDDGNEVVTDACVNCAAAACGDGIVFAGIEQCDSGLDCDVDCTPLRCVEGIPQCNGDRVVQCDGGVFSVINNCPRIGATCSENGFFTYCENTIGEQCYDDIETSRCAGGICVLDGVGSGTCRTGGCEAPEGQCVRGVHQTICTDDVSFLSDCAAFGATCVANTGCVVPANEPCSRLFVFCDAGDRIEQCPDDNVCPAAFVDDDGVSLTAPINVAIPSTTIFDLAPARDQDCVSFTLSDRAFIRFTATLPGDACLTAPLDPELEVVDETGVVVMARRNVSWLDFCVDATAAFDAGTYRACVFESENGERGGLLDVSLSIAEVIVPEVTLPYTETLPLLDETQTCFSFALEKERRVIVDAGSLDPRCLNGMDTTAGLGPIFTRNRGGEAVDDFNLCGRLIADAPVAAGAYVACVAAVNGAYSNVPINITFID
jgi:cysteine-rich repeat protein